MEKEWKANTGYVSLFQRSANTLLLAYKISKAVKRLEKELADAPWLDEEERHARWATLHRQNARMTHRHILKYRGFLTKVGQGVSLKAGELPSAWVEELRGLQDELPVSALKEVRQTIKTDLGRPLEQIFKQFSDRPIASASVAQAHVAYLNTTGQKVCVKVQHRGVADMVGTDLKTVEFIFKRITKYHPDAPDGTDLIREWRRASREEVDFKLEAANALKALAALERAGVDVGCVEPLPAYCGRRVLTMSFIEGWKITDLEKLPPGTDREALARPLVDAFAMLVFNEGLIHGDPHPGNVFVEKLPDGRLRAALLDWGIVQRMTDKERASAARWVLASLAQDRMLFIRSLIELGFEFDTYADQDHVSFLSFVEVTMASCSWMFRDAIPSSAHLQIMAEMQKHQEKADKAREAQEQQDASFTKVLSKVPGIVLFFLRGLEMLQQICGILDVPVQFAQICLGRAMPVVQATQLAEVSRALPAAAGCSRLELAVREKIKELDEAGLFIGAQICVLSCLEKGCSRTDCNVICGRQGTLGAPLTDNMLVPLIDNSYGVLLLCLLAGLNRSTVTGKVLTLDLPVCQLWPEFAQRDKSSVTIGQLLQHRAGFSRCFPSDISLKGYCLEARMEQSVAGAPGDPQAVAAAVEAGADPCRAMGLAVAVLLRRAMGYTRVSDALADVLRPLGLKDIVYSTEPARMARIGRKPQESLSVERIFEALEEKADTLDQAESSAPWLTWQELARKRPVYTDPLLVNRDSLRSGDGCIPGRGLRATAEAVATLFAKDLLSEGVRLTSLEHAGSLKVASRREWHDLGGPLELSTTGWRLFRVRRINDRSEAVGYGSVDGATGSVILRLPEHSIAILLTSADKCTRDAGAALMDTVLTGLGWEALWRREPPEDLPERPGNRRPTSSPAASPTAVWGDDDDLEANNVIAQLEAKVARLAEALERVAPGVDVEDVLAGDLEGAVGVEGLEGVEGDEGGQVEKQLQDQESEVFDRMSGEWASVDTKGLDSLLEAFEVPSMVRAMVVRAKRALKVEVRGEQVTLMTKTTVMGKSIEETTTTFVVGDEFEGQQTLGGNYRGISWWINNDVGEASGQDGSDGNAPKVRSLALEKHFAVEDREIVLEERLSVGNDDTLDLTVVLRAPGDCEVHVRDAQDREILCSALDPKTLRINRMLTLGDEQLMRTGRIVSVGPGTTPQRFHDVQHMIVPATAIVRYEDLEATTKFKRTGGARGSRVAGGQRRRGGAQRRRTATPASASSAERLENGAGGSGAAEHDDFAGVELSMLEKLKSCVENAVEDLRDYAPMALAGCALGVAVIVGGVGRFLSVTLESMGRGLLAACEGQHCAAPCTANGSGTNISGFGGAVSADEVVVLVDRSGGDSLGADLGRLRDATGESNILVVKRLRDVGLFQRWNAEHPEAPILPKDVFVQVNGVSAQDGAPRLLEEIHTRGPLRIRLRRGGTGRTTARPPAEFPPPLLAPPPMMSHPVPLGTAAAAADEMRSEVSHGSQVSQTFRSAASSQRPRHDREAYNEACASAPSAPSAPFVAQGELPSLGSGASGVGATFGTEVSAAPAVVAGLGGPQAREPPESSSFAARGIRDPRSAGRAPLAVLAFDCSCTPGSEGSEGACLLSNACDLGFDALCVSAPCDAGAPPKAFRNAEAAFHALKFWALGGTFSRLTASAAAQKSHRLQQHADPTYAGYGSEWRAMSAVLLAKFAHHAPAAQALLGTGDAFLVAHLPERSPGSVWSTGGDGEGLNKLGLLLLLVRDALSERDDWTAYLRRLFDERTGNPLSDEARREWQNLTRAAVAGAVAAE